jgi:hypothetical protein
MMGRFVAFACRLPSLVPRLLPVALVLALAPGPALAQAKVGGHVGLATPLVTVPSEGDTIDIGDQFTLVAPIGVTVALNERLAVDFEFQVGNPIDPNEGQTSNLVVAPGLIFKLGGPFAAGLRVASEIEADPNVGVIPLLNVGLVPIRGGTWFVEAAFPTFVHAREPDVTFTVVLHTGIGF